MRLNNFEIELWDAFINVYTRIVVVVSIRALHATCPVLKWPMSFRTKMRCYSRSKHVRYVIIQKPRFAIYTLFWNSSCSPTSRKLTRSIWPLTDHNMVSKNKASIITLKSLFLYFFFLDVTACRDENKERTTMFGLTNLRIQVIFFQLLMDLKYNALWLQSIL